MPILYLFTNIFLVQYLYPFPSSTHPLFSSILQVIYSQNLIPQLYFCTLLLLACITHYLHVTKPSQIIQLQLSFKWYNTPTVFFFFNVAHYSVLMPQIFTSSVIRINVCCLFNVHISLSYINVGIFKFVSFSHHILFWKCFTTYIQCCFISYLTTDTLLSYEAPIPGGRHSRNVFKFPRPQSTASFPLFSPGWFVTSLVSATCPTALATLPTTY